MCKAKETVNSGRTLFAEPRNQKQKMFLSQMESWSPMPNDLWVVGRHSLIKSLMPGWFKHHHRSLFSCWLCSRCDVTPSICLSVCGRAPPPPRGCGGGGGGVFFSLSLSLSLVSEGEGLRALSSPTPPYLSRLPLSWPSLGTARLSSLWLISARPRAPAGTSPLGHSPVFSHFRSKTCLYR